MKAGAVRSISGRRGLRVRCTSGIVWLTQTGDGRDIVLTAAKSFICRRRGKLTISALEPAVVEIRLARWRIAFRFHRDGGNNLRGPNYRSV